MQQHKRFQQQQAALCAGRGEVVLGAGTAPRMRVDSCKCVAAARFAGIVVYKSCL
jgi:hypothetical protein